MSESMIARRPEARPPHRIAALASLPVFHKLGGHKVVVAGDGEGALWKAELLAAAGAHVHVFAPAEADRFAALAADPPAGSVQVHARLWLADDLAGSRIAIAEVADDAEAGAFVSAARAAGAVVNIIDRPAFCDFQFGSIVNRSPLLVAISTDGAAPVFGQAIRAKIEAMLPRGLQAWAQAAHAWRPALQAGNPSFRQRRHFWERFTALALRHADRLPGEDDRAALFEASPASESGHVVLVGAGPGDPELLTLKAVRALQAADVILHDDLVSAGVLDLARREARRMLVGKTGHGPSCKQADITSLMVRLARQGRRVVRLKGGDPMIFGRATEEIAACRAAGISVEIVPGVTTAQAAAAALGVSLTERGKARRVQYLTGHAEDGRLPGDVNWQAVADPGVTTVVYMPRRHLARLSREAIAAGLPAGTPACLVQNVSRPEEVRVTGTVATLAELAEKLPEAGPVIALIGQVLDGLAAAIPAGADRIRAA